VLYLKHLLRGVGLGLFDEATAMQKFQVWHNDHEAQIKKRSEENRRTQRSRRNPPVVRRVERGNDAPVQGANEA
jgi:small subunit ribosomal protein S16